MAFRDVVDIIIRADGSAAAREFGALGKSMDGAAKKAQTAQKSWGANLFSGIENKAPGAARALESIGINAGTMGTVVAAGAAAAGAAVVGFAVKSVAAFQDLALESGKLSDKTGLAVEEASRWIEVGSDVGISAEQMSTSFGMLAKNIGKNPAKFAELGITASDTNGKILQAIDVLNKTPDATQRAALGAELFGRSWGEMAELIEQGSDEVGASLAEVSGGRLKTEKDVAAARKLRAGLDELNDMFTDVSQTVGGTLVPVISDAIDEFIRLKDAVEAIPHLPAEFLTGQDWLPVSNLKAGLQFLPGIGPLLSGAALAMEGMGGAAEDTSIDMDKLRKAADNVQQGFDPAGRAAAGFADSLSEADKQAAATAVSTDEMATAAERAAQSQAQFNEVMANVSDAKWSATVDALSAAYERAAGAAAKYLASQLAIFDSQLALDNSFDTVETAVSDLATKYGEMTTAQGKYGKGSKEATDATEAFSDSQRGAKGDILTYAAASVKAAADTKGLAVADLSARDAAILHNKALDTLAAEFPGLKGLIDGYRINLDKIPPAKKTDVKVTDNGTAAATQGKVDRLHGKSLTVAIRGDFSSLDRGIALRRSRAAGGGLISFDTGGIVPGSAGQAVPITAHGREVVLNPDQQARTLFAIANGAARNGPPAAPAGGSVVMNVTINMPPGSDGADVVQALETYKRRGGGPRIAALV